MFCKNSGQELADDAEYCRKCGTPVTAQNIVSRPSTNKFGKFVTAMMITDTVSLLVIAVFVIALYVNLTELSEKIESEGSLEVSVFSDEGSDDEDEDDNNGDEDEDDNNGDEDEDEDEDENDNRFDDYDDLSNDGYYYEDEYDSSRYDEETENTSQFTASSFLGTWSYTSYISEKTVTFYSDGTFSGSIPIYFLDRSVSTYFTLSNGDWSFLEQEQVLSVRDIMYSFSPSKLHVEMTGDILTIYFDEIGGDSCVLTKVK
ncbi:MAG: hypothetical protein NC084_07120 [Bacteroides sp.]|nr:hypothetical protein [Eubacterium sp.]MCM1418368.1 hypothetical protein [Roseburia sp.]MCM1462469.1 hypothetical protein [Bacteroides sp.]